MPEKTHTDTVRISGIDWIKFVGCTLIYTTVVIWTFWAQISSIKVQQAVLMTNQAMLIQYMVDDRRK